MTGLGDRLLRSAGDALAIARGEADPATYRVHVPEVVDVRAMRRRLDLTQAAFADRFGFSLAAVRDWEQGRRRPERATRLLLKLVDREPDAVARVLAAE